MCKRQAFCVEEKPVQDPDAVFDIDIRDRVVPPLVIRSVSDDRVIERGEMHADLMSTSGLDLDIYERELLEPFANFP